jgi:hypothetical protein
MKVWATGCSWTSGAELQYPSHESYDTNIRKYVSDLNHWGEYNLADAGHSNQYVFRTAIEIAEKMNKEEDILLVQWTSPFRQELITTDGIAFYAPFEFASLKFLYGNKFESFPLIGPKNISVDDFRKTKENQNLEFIVKYSKKFMNETYMELMSYNMQISLHHLLKSIGIKSLQFYAWEECKIKSKNIWNIIPENENFLKETFQSVLNDNGFYLEGKRHPNKEMHKLFAEFLIDKLEKLNYIKPIKKSLI